MVWFYNYHVATKTKGYKDTVIIRLAHNVNGIANMEIKLKQEQDRQ